MSGQALRKAFNPADTSQTQPNTPQSIISSVMQPAGAPATPNPDKTPVLDSVSGFNTMRNRLRKPSSMVANTLNLTGN